MSRYFMHLRNGSDELLDSFGCEHRTLSSLRKSVVVRARDILAAEIRNGLMDLRSRIDAENAKREVVFTLPFSDAFKLIGDARPAVTNAEPEMTESSAPAYGTGAESGAKMMSAPTRLTIALAWIAACRARDDAFDDAIFVAPAWDVLLELYVGHAQGRPEFVKSVCAVSRAPQATIGRWISLLEKQGLVQRTEDPIDKRRTLLSLTPIGLARVEIALDDTARSDARLGLGRFRIN